MIFRHLLNMQSHPTWVRGLKPIGDWSPAMITEVAPYVGAWIETPQSIISASLRPVAPYVGAWIETCYTLK